MKQASTNQQKSLSRLLLLKRQKKKRKSRCRVKFLANNFKVCGAFLPLSEKCLIVSVLQWFHWGPGYLSAVITTSPLAPRRDENSHRSPEGNNRRAERGGEKEEQSGESERGDTPAWRERLISFSSCPFHYSECSVTERMKESSCSQKVRKHTLSLSHTHTQTPTSLFSSELILPFYCWAQTQL